MLQHAIHPCATPLTSVSLSGGGLDPETFPSHDNSNGVFCISWKHGRTRHSAPRERSKACRAQFQSQFHWCKSGVTLPESQRFYSGFRSASSLKAMVWEPKSKCQMEENIKAKSAWSETTRVSSLRIKEDGEGLVFTLIHGGNGPLHCCSSCRRS